MTLTQVQAKDTGKKYEITNECMTVQGLRREVKVCRIKALKDVGDKVKRGDLGGWLQSENNLSQTGSSWVAGAAIIYDNAIVYDNATVNGIVYIFDNARVYGNAVVDGNVTLTDNVKIYDNATVYGEVIISDDVEVFNNAKIYNGPMLMESLTICGNAEIQGKICIRGMGELSGDIKISPLTAEDSNSKSN